MEKLSYGTISSLDLIFQNIKKQFLRSIQGWAKLIRRPSFRFRTYTGVAGIIRRRMVVSISVALFSGSFSILIGFYLYASKLADLTEAITVVGMFFIMGLMLNGWLILRMMSNPLKNIEYVEDTLVKMVESGKYRLEGKSHESEIKDLPFIQAYYSLLEHVDTIETHNLEFLAKVSHEIRSPLASILGYTELLTDSELRHDDRFIDNCYHIIRKEGNQVCRLVEDAVLAAGIGSGHYHFEFTPVRVDQLLEHVVDEAKKKLKREVLLENRIGEVTITADAIGLREAINNLVENGVKFSHSNSPVEVRLVSANNPNWIEISVIDHGIGIEEKDNSILFRRFSRIHSEETNAIPGNGLGLYIAHNIIINHQGEIRVESQPKNGSTFKVLLPVERSIQ
jgi:signal transduction histidine kinase